MKSLAFLVVVAAVFVFHSNARAGPYELEIIVQAGDVIDDHTILSAFSSNPGNISINNDGEVAFLARVFGPDAQGWSVMTQRRFIAGAGAVIDGRELGFDNQDHSTKINNLGQVTYTAFLLSDGFRGVFVDKTLIAERGDVVDGRTILGPNRGSAINDDGTVVFVALHSLDPPTEGLFTQDRMVVESGQEIDGFTIGGQFGVEISNTGDIFFRTSLQGFGDGPSEAIVTPDRIVIKPGDVIGGERVYRLAGGSTVGFTINGNGDVVVGFSSLLDGGREEMFVATETEILVRKGDIVDGITIARPVDGRLNNAGQLAFFGFVQNEADDAGYLALFSHDQLIAAEVRLLDGKVVKRLEDFDINDRGDLAFHVEFEDSSRVIVRANHLVPEPSTFVLALLALLSVAITFRRNRRR